MATSIGEKLQSLPRLALYVILLAATSVPLFKPIPIPGQARQASEDFYAIVRSAPPGRTVLIETDWTNSTRGESAGSFKALIRTLMRQDIKFAIYSTADPQAPQVAKDVIRMLNEERKANGQRPYEAWNDWVNAGYFPNAEATAVALNNSFAGAFGDKKDFTPEGKSRPVLESPVLQGYRKLSDFPFLCIITASKTSNIAIERITTVPLIMMVTGVMGPETQVYYDSKQIKGLVAGLKGVYDMEKFMVRDFPGEGMVNEDNGTKYYPSLVFALGLLIIAVVVGNVGMMLSRGRRS
jgi:hypothetical protein